MLYDNSTMVDLIGQIKCEKTLIDIGYSFRRSLVFDHSRLQTRNDRWHFPDKDDDASKQNKVPHNQHSDASSFENAMAKASQFHYYYKTRNHTL
jgi:hypothetical protein